MDFGFVTTRKSGTGWRYVPRAPSGFSPAFLTLLNLFNQHTQDQDGHTDGNGAVGDIENKEISHRDKIGDMPLVQTVNQVAHCAGKLQNQRHPLPALVAFGELGVLNPRRTTPGTRLEHRVELKRLAARREQICQKVSGKRRADRSQRTQQ